jgi:hypothetical protein
VTRCTLSWILFAATALAQPAARGPLDLATAAVPV